MRKNNAVFQKKKNIILFIYGYACQLCGLIDISNHVHHIDKNHANNDSYNLVPLCSQCHKLVHKNLFIAFRDPDENISHSLQKLNRFL